MLDVQQTAPVSVTPPAVALNFTVAQLSVATPVNNSSAVDWAQSVDTAARGVFNAPTQAQAVSAFFASKTVVGGMAAPGGNLLDASTGLGAADAPSPDSGVQWFAPSPGGGALAPPAVVPPSETAETAPGLSVLPAQSAAEPYLAASKWNGDPGSTREQAPIYGSDTPNQSAAGLVLLGAVMSGRRRTSPEETKARRHSN